MKYIRTHWRGEFSLARSYWVNGVLLTIVLRMADEALAEIIFAHNNTQLLRPESALIVLIIEAAVLVTVTVWQLVGIWRSAALHKRQTGRRGWATLAQAVVVLGWIGTAGTAVDYGRLTLRTVEAMRGDTLGEYTVATDGDTNLYLDGHINYQAVDEISSLLGPDHEFQTFFINSPGGYVGASVELGHLVNESGLTVVATGQCLSACTLPLVAAPVSSVTPGTVVGFHRPGATGVSEADDASVRVMESFYRSYGLDIATIAKSMETRTTDMWMPSLDTLVERGIIQYVYDADVSQFLPADRWCAANPAFCR